MRIRVCVYLNETAKANDSRLFERFVDGVPAVEFPYQKTVDTLKVLFGVKSIIVFEIC